MTNKELSGILIYWVRKLVESGGRDWALRIPADENHCPDLIMMEAARRLAGMGEGADSPTRGGYIVFYPTRTREDGQYIESVGNHKTVRVTNNIKNAFRFTGAFIELVKYIRSISGDLPFKILSEDAAIMESETIAATNKYYIERDSSE